MEERTLYLSPALTGTPTLSSTCVVHTDSLSTERYGIIRLLTPMSDCLLCAPNTILLADGPAPTGPAPTAAPAPAAAPTPIPNPEETVKCGCGAWIFPHR